MFPELEIIHRNGKVIFYFLDLVGLKHNKLLWCMKKRVYFAAFKPFFGVS